MRAHISMLGAHSDNIYLTCKIAASTHQLAHRLDEMGPDTDTRSMESTKLAVRAPGHWTCPGSQLR